MNIKCFLFLLIGVLWVPKLMAQNPVAYWKFDNAATPWVDSEGGDNNLWSRECTGANWTNCVVLPTAQGGPGGNHLVQTKDDFFDSKLTPFTSNNCTQGAPIGPNTLAGMTTAAEAELSVEFLFQSGCNFARSTFIDWTNRINFQIIENQIQLRVWTDQLYLFTVQLNGTERRNIGYYSDMEWHHVVITFDEDNGPGGVGELKLYIDGLCHPEFIFHTNTDSSLQTLVASDILYVPGNYRTCGFDPPSRRFDGQLDEYAIYDEALTDEAVLEHYLNFFPNAFSACLTGLPPLGPLTAYDFTPTVVTPAIVACALATLPPDLRPQTTITFPSSGAITGNYSFVSEEFTPNYPDVTVMDDPLTQLQEFPTPRFQPGHTLNQNQVYSDISAGINVVWRPFNSANLNGGTYADYMIDVSDELIQHYNYGLFLGTLDQSLAGQMDNANGYVYKAAEYAVNHPEAQRFINWNWGPERDYQHFVASALTYNQYMSQNLGANANRSNVSQRDLQPLEDHYLMDDASTGFPISTLECDTTTLEERRMWDPTELAVPGLMEADGISQAGWLDEYLKKTDLNTQTSLRNTQSLWGSSVDFLEINQEQLLWNGCALSQNDISFNAATPNLYPDGGTEFTQNILEPLRDGFLTYGPLAGDLSPNFRFTFYDISGHPTYVGPISATQAAHAQNGFATNNFLMPYYYPQRDHDWYQHQITGTTSWTVIVDGRREELAAGLDEFTLNVSPGSNVGGNYTAADFQMMRPASYLGMLKSLSMLGAEDFVPFVYNTNGVAGHEHYGEYNIYQMTMPSYAQATTSRFEDFIDNGELLPGDFHELGTAQFPAYSFSTGSVNDLVVVREDISGTPSNERYAITGTTQRASYHDPQATPVERNVKIDLAGTSGPVVELHFPISRQGNTYIYDRDPETFAAVGTTKPNVFYQVDGWHEWTHPSRWSTDFAFEAEVHDGNNSATGMNGLQNYEPWTEVPNPAQITATVEDYTDYTTYMTWWNPVTECFQNWVNRPSMEYRFIPRVSSQQTLQFYVRARSKSGVSTGLNMELDGVVGSQQTIACITNQTWQWYGLDINANQVEFASLQLEEYILALLPLNSELEIDQVLLTAVGSANIPTLASTSVCSGPNASFTYGQSTCLANAAIQFTNTSGSTTVCATYAWDFGDNNSSTVENPLHTYGAAGSYLMTLTVTDLAGVTSQTSQTVNITLAPSVTAAPDPINICNDECIDVEATVTGGASPYTYSWTHDYTFSGSNYSQSAGTADAICFLGNNDYTNQSLEVTVTDANGCTATYTITSITISTGIKQCSGVLPNGCCEIGPGEGKANMSDPFGFSSSRQAIVYPNPVTERLNVLLNSSISRIGLEIAVKDMQGRTLQSWKMEEKPEPFELNVSDLKSGSYVIQISNAEGTISTETFMKQ